jgi:hypothetical protein
MKVIVSTYGDNGRESVVVEHEASIQITKGPDGGLKVWGYDSDGDELVLAHFAPGSWRHARLVREEAATLADLPDNSEFDNEHPF